MVSSGTMYALSSLFIDNSTHMHCAAQVVDLNSQLIIIIILYSFHFQVWSTNIDGSFDASYFKLPKGQDKPG